MSGLKEKIPNLLKTFFKNKDALDQNEFVELFHALRPEYDLDEEQVREIFSMTDENNEGVIQKAQVERILTAVLASEGDEKKSFASNLGVDIRTSILPSLVEKESFVSVPDDTDLIKQESNKPALRILHDLDLEKLNELKNIFNVCDSDSQGFTSVDQIKLLVNNIKKLSSPAEEIMELFEFIAEGEKRIILKETFYTLMNELEKNIRTFLYSEGEVPEYMARSGKSIFRKTRAISRIDSEMYSNSDDEEYDEINELEEENTEIKLQIKLIIQKTENAVEGMKTNKMKPTDIITMLTENVSILTILGNHLKDNGERIKVIRTQFNDQRSLLEMLDSKVGTFEYTLKNQEQTIEKLQIDNDKLNQQLLFASSEAEMKQHLEIEVKEKNNEIVRLERKLNELQYDKDSFSKKMDVLENDNEILLESYRELESLYKKIELEKKELETSLGSISPQHETKLQQGRESLMLESKMLKDQKTNLESEIDNLQSVLRDVREQLGNNKEFVDTLNLEKNDLQKKLQKMREEYANLNRESLIKRNSSIAGSPDRKRELRMALEQSVSKIKRGHGRHASDTTALTGVLNKRISKISLSGLGLRQIKEEEENIVEKEAENKKESEVRDSSSPKPPDAKILAEKYLANYEKSPLHKLQDKPKVRKQLKFELQKASIDAPEAPAIRLSKVSNARKSEDLLSLLDKRKLFVDYLDLNKKAPIINMLKKYNDSLEEKIFYSDNIYYINTKEQRQSSAIAITGEALYCLEPNKAYRVLRRTNLSHIYRITINQYSVGLLALHVHNDSDYLIDTYRRPKLIRFLKRVFQLKGHKQFALYFEKSFLVQDKDPANALHVSPYNKIMFNPELQAAYKNANKIGELYLREWSLFNRWNKYLFMLTNIGLFYFKEAGSLTPSGYIPIIDYLLINKKENPSEDKHEFKIKFQYSDFSVTLAAESELEKLEWVTALHKIQENTDKTNDEIEE